MCTETHIRKKQECWSPKVWVQILDLRLYLSMPQFLHPYNGDIGNLLLRVIMRIDSVTVWKVLRMLDDLYYIRAIITTIISAHGNSEDGNILTQEKASCRKWHMSRLRTIGIIGGKWQCLGKPLQAMGTEEPRHKTEEKGP